MIYGGARRHVILTGGSAGGTILDGTWEWDGSSGTDGQWQVLSGVSSPSARTQHRMAYDENTGLIMLFGGCTLNCANHSEATLTNDQYSLGTGSWSLPNPTPRPSARCCMGLVYGSYDPFSSLSHAPGVYLFGGADTTHPGLSDFYFYTSGAWCKLSASSCTTSF